MRASFKRSVSFYVCGNSTYFRHGDFKGSFVLLGGKGAAANGCAEYFRKEDWVIDGM